MSTAVGRAPSDSGAWAVRCREGLQVIAAVLDAPGTDPFHTWVVDGASRLIRELRMLLLTEQARQPRRIAVVMVVPATEDDWTSAAAEAACQAARGIVGALTRERGPDARLNLILVSAAEAPELEETLDFLAAPASSFVAGSVIDLRATA